MKIQSIKITNYKAFYDTYTLKVNGKNLFIYGENGSGKSSLYYALKDFFQSSVEDIDLHTLENIFIPRTKQGQISIKVTFKPDNLGNNRKKAYLFNITQNDTRAGGDTSIRDGNALKSFLTYKHLLAIHHIKKNDSINLFDLLVKGVLKHFKYSLTRGKELGELWSEVERLINKKISRRYLRRKKAAEVEGAIRRFNEAFGELFDVSSPEYILKHARPILDKFNHNIDLKLRFSQIRPNVDYTAIQDDRVGVEISYAGKSIEKPHLFLNEARLSAIAISIYLGMIKRHIQRIPCKVLFLDDIFIGLDISNRLPLLNILDEEFPDYQIFITTYDRPWFEYAKGFLANSAKWKPIEFYAEETKEGHDIPYICDGQDLISKANKHYKRSDYKAAAVYARSAFEQILICYCAKKKKEMPYKKRRKDYKVEDFWKVVNEDVLPGTKANIAKYRALVLNPFSHYDTEKHEFKTELRSAIDAVKGLESELTALLTPSV